MHTVQSMDDNLKTTRLSFTTTINNLGANGRQFTHMGYKLIFLLFVITIIFGGFLCDPIGWVAFCTSSGKIFLNQWVANIEKWPQVAFWLR